MFNKNSRTEGLINAKMVYRLDLNKQKGQGSQLTVFFNINWLVFVLFHYFYIL